MKRFWDNIRPWIDKKHYRVTTLCVFVSLLTFQTFLNEDKVYSETDLITVSGKLSNFSFRHGRRSSRQFDLWLNNYKNAFRIPTDFHDFFDKEKFIRNNLRKSIVTLKIPKNRAEDLKVSDDMVFVFGLSANSEKYLETKLAIEAYQSRLSPIGSFIFILAGIVFYIFKRRYTQNKV